MNCSFDLKTNCRFLILGISLSVCAFFWAGCSAASFSQHNLPNKNSEVYAVVNGITVTRSEVEQAAAADLEKLEQSRVQFEAGLERDKQKSLENNLDKIVENKLIDAEIARLNISDEDVKKAGQVGVSKRQLVVLQIENKAQAPTVQEIEDFYQANRDKYGKPKEQVEEQIRQFLLQKKRDELTNAYFNNLKDTYQVAYYLEPMRKNVAANGPTLGPQNAPVTIVEFSDFQCPFCSKLASTMKDIEKNYQGKIKIVFRQYPLLSIHQNAQKAAEASLCANEQGKFWEFHDQVFSNQKKLEVPDLKETAGHLGLETTSFNSCLDSGLQAVKVQEDLKDGTKLGVNSTPTLFINGRLFVGASYDGMAKMIDDEIRRAKKP